MLFLAIGSLWFDIMIALVCIIIYVSVECEKFGWPTFSVIVTLGLLGWFGDFNILIVAQNNPLWAIGCFIGYFFLGIGWSIGKYKFYVMNIRRKIKEREEDFLKNYKYNTIKDIPKDQCSEFMHQVYGHFGYHGSSDLSLNKNWSRILTWAMYWPFSFTWTIISDPIKHMFIAILNRIKYWYEAIRKSALGDIDNDIEYINKTIELARCDRNNKWKESSQNI
jgi:hypothetical protein